MASPDPRATMRRSTATRLTPARPRQRAAEDAGVPLGGEGESETGSAISRNVSVRATAASAAVRAKVAHIFRIVKCQFGYRKVRYRGIAKNGAQVSRSWLSPISTRRYRSRLASASVKERASAPRDLSRQQAQSHAKKQSSVATLATRADPAIQRFPSKPASAQWLPLRPVGDAGAFVLACGLDILFMRPSMPGAVINAGDIDGRLKTIFDALKPCRYGTECVAADTIFLLPGEHPFYVLLRGRRTNHSSRGHDSDVVASARRGQEAGHDARLSDVRDRNRSAGRRLLRLHFADRFALFGCATFLNARSKSSSFSVTPAFLAASLKRLYCSAGVSSGSLRLGIRLGAAVRDLRLAGGIVCYAAR